MTGHRVSILGSEQHIFIALDQRRSGRAQLLILINV